MAALHGHATTSPNILFIFSDDQCWRELGVLGSQARTPNLDQLAGEGTLFTNAYNMGSWTGAVCVASRTMLTTGRSLWKAHALSQEPPPVEMFWSRRFKEAGYTTYFAGKWHVVGVSPVDIYDRTGTIRPGMAPYVDPSTGEELHGSDRGPGYFRPTGPDDHSWSPSDPDFGGHWIGGQHWSECLGDEAVGFIEEAARSDQPFFMHLAFNAPHDPRQSPQEYVDLYPVESIEVPENFLPEYPFADAMKSGRGLRDEDLAPFPRSDFAVKTHRQEYYAIISHMDAQVGRILEALEKSGLADNTLVVFTSDHGLACGHHGLMGKQNMFEHSMKPPLIFKGLNTPAGKVIDDPVYMQDLMPTTLEYAGIEVPAEVAFHSLLPRLQGGSTNPGQAIYGAYKDSQRMIREGDWKLIWYPAADKYLLFNLRIDPEEMHDVAGSPACRVVLERMQEELRRQQNKYGDPLSLTD